MTIGRGLAGPATTNVQLGDCKRTRTVALVSAGGVVDSTDERQGALVQFETEDGWTVPMRALLDNGAQESVLQRGIFNQIVAAKAKVTEAPSINMIDAEGRPMSRMDRYRVTFARRCG